MKGVDGFLLAPYFAGGHGPWPIETPNLTHERRKRVRDMIPFHGSGSIYPGADREEFLTKVGVPHQYDMFIACGINLSMSIANGEMVTKVLGNIPFNVMFART